MVEKECESNWENHETMMSTIEKEKFCQYSIRNLKPKIIGYGLSIFSLGFLIYLLVGVVNHHLK